MYFYYQIPRIVISFKFYGAFYLILFPSLSQHCMYEMGLMLGTTKDHPFNSSSLSAVCARRRRIMKIGHISTSSNDI